MKDIFYSYSSGQANFINWMRYDEGLDLLIAHNLSKNTIDLFDMASGVEEFLDYQQLLNLSDVGMAIDCHPEKNWIAIAGASRWLIFDYHKKEEVFSHTGTLKMPSINFTADGNEIWVTEQDKQRITIYDGAWFTLKKQLILKEKSAYPLKFHPSGEWFTHSVVGEDGTRVLFGKCLTGELYNPDSYFIETASVEISGLQFSPDGQHIIVADEGIRVYEFPSLTLKYVINDDSEVSEDWTSSQHPAIFWSSPVVLELSRQVMASCMAGMMWYWDLLSGKKLHVENYVPSPHSFTGLALHGQLLSADQSGNLFWIEPDGMLKTKLQESGY